MQYSIIPVLHPYANKQGLHKVNIQVIYNRKKVYAPTNFKLLADHWKDGIIVKHPNRKAITDNINNIKVDIEKRLIEALRLSNDISKAQLDELAKGVKVDKYLIENFVPEIIEQLKGKLSHDWLKHFKVMGGKVAAYSPGATFNQVNLQWLNSFEAHIRKTGIEINTVHVNMKILKGIFYRASEAGLIKKEQFEDYKLPRHEQKLVEYLTEQELEKIFDFIKFIDKPGHKRAGYYFMLSCYTGYRLSDAKAFDYNAMVQDNTIVLRAKKNKSVVSIPVHSKLATVLDFVKDNPLNLSEQKVREYVKEICSFVGIKKKVKFHTSRHSWAMLLMAKGFSIDEVAETLGDTPKVARIYARISNIELSKKIIDRLG